MSEPGITRFEPGKLKFVTPGDTLVYAKRGGGEKRIPPDRWWINRNTPVGDPAELWERMPNGGRRELNWGKLPGVVLQGETAKDLASWNKRQGVLSGSLESSGL